MDRVASATMSATLEAHRVRQQHKAPVGLNVKDVLNPGGEENRDSAYFSSDASSKHTSAASFGLSGLSPAHSGYHSSPADKTPSPTTTNLVPQPLVSPSVSNMSVASMVSPTTPLSADPRRYDRPTSLDSIPGNAALGDQDSLSRRESVDSRINQGFHDMRLGNSPYASHNQSTVSIQPNLSTQRNPRPGLDSLSVHRISNGYQPSTERNPEPHPKIVKTAPAITGPAQSTIARAAEPTKGQAWAFPEEDIQRIPPGGGTFLDSRRSSVADSLASSQFTTESRLPPGQRRLDEGTDFNRLSSASADFPPVHHHSIQHKQLDDLQSEDGRSQAGSQPYSRTPELRQSHKLAERKRRTEMKELFDQLRDLMPQERGSKASKWEILTKAISEYQKQNDHIRALQTHYNSAQGEAEMMRREIHNLRMENDRLRDLPPSAGPAPSHPPPLAPTQPAPYSSDPYANPPRELPPLRSISNPLSNGPDSMTGVQYESQRVNAFRPERY